MYATGSDKRRRSSCSSRAAPSASVLGHLPGRLTRIAARKGIRALAQRRVVLPAPRGIGAWRIGPRGVLLVVRHRGLALGEHREADHADVARLALARGVGVADVAQAEGGDLGLAAAEAVD